ncbi:PEP-CTERM protein-sorting domain [Methylophilaceae bacterium]
MMKNTRIAVVIAALFMPAVALAATPISSITKEWTYSHTRPEVPGIFSEISAYDSITNTIWVAGIVGVDVLNATNGSLVQHIDTRSFGSINSLAIYNGMAAFAIQDSVQTNPGVVKLFDTTSRSLVSGVNSITVGALPDMITFTPDGSKLLVANEGTPTTYGTRIGTTIPRSYNPAAVDPAGSVSIIDVGTRAVLATPGFVGVTQTGSNIRTNTGMDFEPEYIAVNATGTKAYVTLQEANAIGILDLNTNTFEKVVGLGTKDFSLTGNTIDTRSNALVNFASANVKGLYMPDGIAAYEVGGATYLVTANEGDFREDDGDRSNGSTVGGTGDLAGLRISNTDSSTDNLFAAGARSFSILDANGTLVFDSGDFLDKKAAELGIYDDTRSIQKGVEPEGVELFNLNGRVIAAIGLERTLKGAVALYDITDPVNSTFLDMIVTEGDVAPEGLEAFTINGISYLAIANEVSNTTTLYSLAPVPEPETYALLIAGLGLVGFSARRRQKTA